MFKKLMLCIAIIVAISCQAVFAADLTKLIPEDTDFVFQINVSKILSNPDIQKQIQEALNKDEEQKKQFEEFKAKAAFDPLKDIANVVLFTSGKIVENQEALGGAVIEGNFNPEKFVAALKEDKSAMVDVTPTVIDGFTCIVPKNNKEGYAIFLDKNYLVVGSQVGCDAVKAIKMGKQKPIQNKEFLSVLSKVNSASTLSGVGLLPKTLKNKCLENPNFAFLANVDSFFFDFNNDKNMVFNFNAQIDKEENVKAVESQITGFVQMIKMIAGSQLTEVAEAMNKIIITSEKNVVKMSFDIPAEKIIELKQKIEEKAKELEKQNGGNSINGPRKEQPQDNNGPRK